MALDSKRRAKQLAKRTSKDKARRERKRSKGLLAHFPGMAQLSLAPVHQALIPEKIFDIGIGNVVLSRKLGHTVWMGVFLVDSFCLGVKNAWLKMMHEAEYGPMIATLEEKDHLISIEPSCARKLIEDAVAYAQDLGFGPHKEYRRARLVFGDIDAEACPTSFAFGENGKPNFISGPNDSEARCREILEQLVQRCGPQGFHYMVVQGNEGIPFFDEDEFDQGRTEEKKIANEKTDRPARLLDDIPTSLLRLKR